MGIISLISRGFPNDEEIIHGIKNHEERYSTILYNKHRNNCIKYICKKYKPYIDENLAMDIYQDSVIIMYQNILNGKFELRNDTKIETYLTGVCKYQALNVLRLKGKGKLSYELLDNIDQHMKDNDEIEDLEKESIILEELKKMDQKCYDILYLFYYRNKTMETMALELNYMNADTVKAQKYRCQKYLKEAVTNRTALC